MMKQLIIFGLMILLVSCKQDKAVTESPTAVEAVTKVTEVSDETPPKVMTEASLDLTKYGIANNPTNVLGGLKVGDLAPDFTALTNRGRTFNLDEYTGRTPIILTFFRGSWCGYCTKHLAEFSDNLKELQKAANATVVAVTPEAMKGTRKLANENSFTFNLIPDDNHEIMKKYKVFFHATEDYNQKVLNYNKQDLKAFNQDREPILPVPATYVIGQDMRVKYVFYDPDYSKRPPMEEILAALQ